LVPPVRLGGLLRDTRVGRGVSLDQLASQSFFTTADLVAVESGERALTDRELGEILSVYHVEAEQLLPERTELRIDLGERTIAVGGHRSSVAGRAPTADEVLVSYLSLVYTLRNTKPGHQIVLRAADVDVLAQALDLARPTVTARLHSLMAEPSGAVHRRARVLRGRVLVPLAGVVVAVTALGTLMLVQADEPQTLVTESGAPTPAFIMTNPDGTTTPVYIGDGLRLEDLPPGAVALAPATQQYPDGLVVVNADGQAVPLDRPPNEVWLG
jgi:hypothetical protein